MSNLNVEIPKEIMAKLHTLKIMSGKSMPETTTRVLEAGLKVEPQVPGNKKDK